MRSGRVAGAGSRMHRSTWRVSAIAVAALLAVWGTGAIAEASAPLPVPGTAKAIQHLVATSPSIRVLPRNLTPPVAQIHLDNPWAYFKTLRWPDCPTLTSCVLGDTASRRVIVLFGDSHALMWLPAIEPVAQHDGYRLDLVWSPNCPAASVTYWNWPTRSYATGCDQWRTSSLAAIRQAHPHLVLLASETADRWASSRALMSDAQWKAGLLKTISLLHLPGTKIAVIGDIQTLDLAMPDCLAAYPTAVQRCGVALPNPVVKNRGHQLAEAAAAREAGVLYVNTLPWLCTTTWCSPIVGTMVSYINDWHVTATYAHFLSGVFGDALRPAL